MSIKRIASWAGYAGAMILVGSFGWGISVAQAFEVTAEQREACTPDAFRLCSAEIPDVDRVAACMQANKANLSARCRAVFVSFDQTRGASQPLHRAHKIYATYASAHVQEHMTTAHEHGRKHLAYAHEHVQKHLANAHEHGRKHLAYAHEHVQADADEHAHKHHRNAHYAHLRCHEHQNHYAHREYYGSHHHWAHS